ncbi:hypothetical protein PRUB_b0013 [Pseudoalteromonas rubra]|uniref:Uncharacterized protein n=1 Tax=Pseudoalteromonas rubra TaxID=43658 RepID=A0A8T0BXL7_9GAMM|nr:hypothetical protein PRUB_b0013 [Pseudoalteromonas rubra]
MLSELASIIISRINDGSTFYLRGQSRSEFYQQGVIWQFYRTGITKKQAMHLVLVKK